MWEENLVQILGDPKDTFRILISFDRALSCSMTGAKIVNEGSEVRVKKTTPLSFCS